MATSPPILIHAGYQKTASTFLQNRIFSDDALFAAPWGTQAAMAIEAFILCHPARFDVSAIRAEFADTGGRIPVISHEDLLGYPIYGRYHAESALTRMAQAFPNARLLVCVREQSSMLMAQYLQYIRQGGAETIQTLLTGNENRPGFRPVLRRDHFEYDLSYDLACAHFPKDQVLFMPHELMRADPHAYVARLNGFLGTSLEAQRLEQVVYARRGDAAILLERWLNHWIPVPSVRPARYEDNTRALRLKNTLIKRIDPILSRHTRIGERQIAKIRHFIDETIGQDYAASNQRLSDRIGLDLGALGYPVTA